MGGARGLWELSVPSPQYCSEPKTALKVKSVKINARNSKVVGCTRAADASCRSQKAGSGGVWDMSTAQLTVISEASLRKDLGQSHVPRSSINSKSKGDRIKDKMTKNHLLSGKYFPPDTYSSGFVV